MRIALVLVLLAACNNAMQFHAVNRPVAHEDGAADRAVAALVSYGYTVDTQAAGTVTSAWFVEKDGIGDQFHMRWVVSIDGGEATVDLQCNRGKVGGPNCDGVVPGNLDWNARAAEIAERVAK